MIHHDFDRFDRRNDPDLQDPPRCRHRDGDPDCECHPEEETVEPEIDADEQFSQDLTFAFGWCKQLHDGIPPEVTEEQVSDEDVRRDLNKVRTDVLAIIATFREGWLETFHDPVASEPSAT